MNGRRFHDPCRGFTLVELVVVIVIIGILSAVTGAVIYKPVQSFVDLDRRAGLTDTADTALRLLAREVRAALPNSLRVSGVGNNTLELIHTVDAGRYRTANAAPDGVLRIGAADRVFDLVGGFYQTTALPANARLVVYNTGTTPGDVPYNAYLASGDAGNMTAADNGITLGAFGSGENPGEQRITLTRNHTFRAPGSPSQRIFLVDGPITYTCTGGVLVRYSGYTPAAATAVPPAPPFATAIAAGGGSGTAACSFNYTAGTGTAAGLLTINLTITAGGESVTLLRQVRVDNVP